MICHPLIIVLTARQRTLHAEHMATVINDTIPYFVLEGEKEQFNKFSWKSISNAFKDWHVYVYCFLDFCTLTLIYNNSMFLPSIVKGMGFSSINAQLMVAPANAIGK